MKQKILWFCSLFLILILFSKNTVLASSASAAFVTSTAEIEKGNTITVDLIAESSVVMRDFDAYISYDQTVLQFQSGGKYASGGNGLIHIKDIGNKKNEQKKYTLKFLAIDMGVCDISFADTVYITEAETNEAMSVSKNAISIEVKERALNNDASLKSLTIHEGKLEPKFDGKVREYSTTVSSETKTLFIDAKPKNQNAAIAINGNQDLTTGENVVTIQVTSESGEIKDYIVRVKKRTKQEDAYENEQKKEDEKEEEIKTKGLNVYSKSGRTYMETAYRYEIVSIENTDQIPKGYIRNSLILNEVRVPVYTLEKEPDNEYVLIYVKNEDGDTVLYQYDRIEKTMQRFHGEFIEIEGEAKEEKSFSEVEYENRITQLSIVSAVLAAFATILLLVIIKMLLSRKRSNDDDI